MRARKQLRHLVALLMAIVMLMSTMPVPAFAAETDEPTKSMDLIVSSAAETVGNTVQVTISVANNPGIASLKFKVAFDSVLTLTNVEFNSELGAMVTAPKPYTNPQTITLISPMEDVYANGVLATLTFAIDENAENGYVADVTVTYDAKDIFDSAEEPVALNVVNGTVSMYTGMPGDVDGNGEVNTKDAVALFRYVADWDIDVDPNALDVNGDDHVDTKDAIMLFRYVSGWEGILLNYSHDHRFSYTEAVDATCTEDGNIAYYYCSLCKRYYTDTEAMTRVEAESIVVKATGHSFSTEWTHDETHHWYAATCEHTEEVKDKGEHTYGDDKVCDVCAFDSNYLYKLAAPTDVAVAYDLITWTAVPNADSYTVVVNGDYEYTTRNTECSLTSVRNSAGDSVFADRAATKRHGQVTVVVYANANGQYTKSDASQVALYYYVPSAGTNQEATAYGLGLGYNMIETGFHFGMEEGDPVFDLGKLLAVANLTATKGGGGSVTRSYSYTSIDDYTEQYISNNGLSFGFGTGDNSDKKEKSSFVAGLKTDLSYGTSSNYTTHQYFCSYVVYSEAIAGTVGFDNQNEDIRIHCLSEQFVKDIRRESAATEDLTDEDLCWYLYTTYGTHVALGIVKGGYFVTSYTVWTNSEEDLQSAKDAFALAVSANLASYFNASLSVENQNEHTIKISHESTVSQLVSGNYGGTISAISPDKAAHSSWTAPTYGSNDAVALSFAGSNGAVALSTLISEYEKEFGDLGLYGENLGLAYARYVDKRATALYDQLYSRYTYEPPFEMEVVNEDGKNVLVVDLSMYQTSGDLSAAGCSYFTDGTFTVYPNMLGEDIDAVRLIGGMDNIHANKELLNGFTLALKGRWDRDVEITLENFGAAAKSDYGVVDTSAISKSVNVTVCYEGINIMKDTVGLYYCYVDHGDSSYRFVLTDEESVNWVFGNVRIEEDGIYLPVVTKDNYNFVGWVTGSQTAITDPDGKLDTSQQLGAYPVTIYMDWTPEIYTITLYNKNASTPGTNEIFLMYGVGYTDIKPTSEDFEKIDSITIPTMTGYMFGGYYTAEEVDETKVAIPGKIQYIDKNGRINDVIESRVSADIAFKDDVMLYPEWIPVKYTIVYVVQSSSAGDVTVTGSVEPTDCTYNDPKGYTLRSGDDLKCFGKTFAGWSQQEDCTGEILYGQCTENLSTTNGAEVKLYAVWTDNTAIKLQADKANNTYTSVLYLIPNSEYDAIYSDKDCTEAVAQLPQRPTRPGYTFGGYYDSVENNSSPNPTGIVERIDANGLFVVKSNEDGSVSYAGWIEEDNTLEAMWTAIPYTIVYDANKPGHASHEVTGTPANDAGCFYDVDVKLGSAPALTGWTFGGWYTADGTKVGDAGGIADGEILNQKVLKNLVTKEDGTVTATVTLYAKWTANTHSVIYYSNDGLGKVFYTNHTYDSTSYLAEYVFYRSDYTLLGWSTNQNATVPEYKLDQKMTTLSEDLVLYAVWVKTEYSVQVTGFNKNITNSNNNFSLAIFPGMNKEDLKANGYTSLSVTIWFYGRGTKAITFHKPRLRIYSCTDICLYDDEFDRFEGSTTDWQWRYKTYSISLDHVNVDGSFWVKWSTSGGSKGDGWCLDRYEFYVSAQ